MEHFFKADFRISCDTMDPIVMKKLFLKTYGCQMNVRDSEEVTGLLLKRGYALAQVEEQAAVILYNTCAVREHVEHREGKGRGRFIKGQFIGRDEVSPNEASPCTHHFTQFNPLLS